MMDRKSFLHVELLFNIYVPTTLLASFQQGTFLFCSTLLLVAWCMVGAQQINKIGLVHRPYRFVAWANFGDEYKGSSSSKLTDKYSKIIYNRTVSAIDVIT